MKKRTIYFLIIFFVIGLVSVIANILKQDYFVDELWTASFSNSEYTPHVNSYSGNGNDVRSYMEENIEKDSKLKTIKNSAKLYKNLYIDRNAELINKFEDLKNPDSISWKSGKEYLNALAPSEQTKFNYYSVYYNTCLDNHPILYYALYHTFSSLTPNVFTKWTGFMLNAVFMLPALILLFFMIRRFYDEEIIAYGTLIAYGLSIGFITTMTFFRMYAMVTFFTIATLYMHLCIFNSGETIKFRYCILLILCTSFGVLSQYFYIFYCVGIFLVSFIYLIKYKRLSDIIKYCLSMLISVIVVLVVWPFTIEDLFFSGRGKEAIGQSFSLFGYIYKFARYIKVILENCFGNNIVLLGLFAILTIFLLYVNRKKLIISFNKVLIYVPCIICLMIVTQMAPYQTTRYIMNLFWAVSLLVVEILFNFIKYKKICNYKKSLIIVLLVLSVSGFVTGKGEYLYFENVETNNLIAQYAGKDCIAVVGDRREMFKSDYFYTYYQNFDKVLAIALEDLKRADMTPINDDSEIVLFADKDNKSIKEEVKAVTGFRNDKLLAKEYKGADVYVLSR